MLDYIKSNMLIFVLIFLAVVAPQFFFGAMRVVLYIVIAIFILLFLLVSIFRFRVQRIQREMNNQGSQRGQGGQGTQSRTYSYTWDTREADSKKSKGDGVNIITPEQETSKRVSKDVGDYVDFEEVD